MQKFKFTTISLSLFSCLICGCNNEEILPTFTDVNNDGEIVSDIKVLPTTRSVFDDPVLQQDSVMQILSSTSFPEGAKIFISQKGTTLEPSFPPNSTAATPNLYSYMYNGNTEADWEDGYNFSLAPGSNPIEWATIKNNGSVGNSFVLYSLYFPSGTIGFNVNGQNNMYSVAEWQNNTNAVTLCNYDIQGAYHSFSSTWSRLRFRMYHLMTCIHVTVYLPVLKTKSNGTTTGFDECAFRDSKHQTTSNVRSFIPGCFLGASSEHAGNTYYMNISRAWTIDFDAVRSSDKEGPLVSYIPITASNSQRGNVCLFPHIGPQYNAFQGDYHNAGFSRTKIKVTDFYPNANAGDLDAEGYDEVYRYDFTCFIPPQTIMYQDRYPEWIYFHIKAPGSPDGIDYLQNNAGSLRRYYFSSSQLVTGKNEIELTEGTINHISLYVPRSENKIILVSANVLPWTEAVTDMTIVDEDDLTEDQY